MAPEKGGDPRQWGGPAQSSSTRRAPRPTITKSSTSHTVLFHLKRFPRSKQVFKPLLYRLKRFHGTKFRLISDSGKVKEKSDRNRKQRQPGGRSGRSRHWLPKREGTHASGEDRRSPALPAGRPGSQTEQKTEQSGNSGLFCHYVDVNMC